MLKSYIKSGASSSLIRLLITLLFVLSYMPLIGLLSDIVFYVSYFIIHNHWPFRNDHWLNTNEFILDFNQAYSSILHWSIWFLPLWILLAVFLVLFKKRYNLVKPCLIYILSMIACVAGTLLVIV